MLNFKTNSFGIICLLTILSISCTNASRNISKYQFFWAAIIRGNSQLVAKYVKEGIDLEKKDQRGNTALLYALSKQQSSIAKYLIDNGAKIDVTNKRGQTPFSLATRQGDASLLGLIIKESKRKSFKIEYKEIKTAIDTGRLDVLKSLLKNKKDFDINHTYPSSMTLLMMATIQGHKKIVEYLINLGCDLSKKDKSGNTALNYAMLLEKKEIIPILKSKEKE